MSFGWKVPDFTPIFGADWSSYDESSRSGLDWDPEVNVAPETEEEARETELTVGDLFFSDEEMAAWTGHQAMLWILDAGTAFEVLGIRPKPVSARSLLRRRYHRLSLLTHPDKNPEPEADAAFKKLSDSMRILTSSEDQEKLLRYMFPKKYGEATPAAGGKQAAGFYDTPKSRRDLEAARYRMEMEERLHEEQREERELKEADQATSERLRQTSSLTEILKASKARSIGKSTTATTAGTSSAPAAAPAAKRPRRAPSGAAGSQQAPPSWGLPQEFMPATSSTSTPKAKSSAPGKASDASAAADPNTLWRLTGAAGLAANGWQRLESRSHPGKFYFLHSESGRREMAVDEGAPANELPAGWQKRASKSRPGTFYYANLKTGETRMDPPGCATKTGTERASSKTEVPAAVRVERQAWPWDHIPDPKSEKWYSQ
eukprot:TRINITY_DN5198_c0_g1_i1.p1 TRINITY_DN5198_c0_g1~~TRINITY_DN5198_c0_g1_i1.p1  ORF type:complete len:431 (+),score=123.47 TRINITY_DN5198_c0_g1_i1:73-1365(+)